MPPVSVISEPPLADRVLEAVAALHTELHRAQARPTAIRLEHKLDEDLGFDSLSRVELLTRLERRFNVHLPETTLGSAETVADLVKALGAAAAVGTRRAPQAAPAVMPSQSLTRRAVPAGVPVQAMTLQQVLRWRVDRHASATHLVLLEGEKATSLSYQALLEGASAVANALRAAGIAPGSTVALMLPTGLDYFHSFFGALLAETIPVPIYPPLRASQLEDHVRRHAAILANAGAQALITVPEAGLVARLLKAQVPTLKVILSGVRPPYDVEVPAPAARTDSIALLQYTSGSTGAPKGVVLTHANVLANIRAIGKRIGPDESDVFVSWLPLYHDMGLIGAWLGSLYFGCTLVIMPPTAFLARPARWLRTIQQYRGTLSASPNFGYELCARRIPEEELAGLDLSSWRIAFNGAEPVSPDTLERFQRRFVSFGFRAGAMAPVYGLAEAAVGLTIPPPGRGAIIDCIDRERLTRAGVAVAVPRDAPNSMRFVSSGPPLPGYQLRIIDPIGSELPERAEGALQFCGPSAAQGYFENPGATAQLLEGQWRNTGDRAYMAGGELYITGREKDIIIRRGRHIYPEEIEQAVGELEGVRKGCVAAFGTLEASTSTEKLVVLAETHYSELTLRTELMQRINQSVVNVIGEPPDEVLLAAPHTVLKTSSGKLRRTATAAAYADGSLGRSSRSASRQLWRLSLASANTVLRRFARAGVHRAYGTFAWASLIAIAAALAPATLLTRRPEHAWALNHRAARLLIRAWRIPLAITWESEIDLAAPHIIIANHCSYVDSLFVAALLKTPHAFVAKADLARRTAVRAYLRRLGTLFVERDSSERSAAEVGRMESVLRQGHSLVVFPEGGFTRQTGLRPFHLGAFQAAVATGVPVIALALRGTRSLLRDEQWLPHRVPISAVFGNPLLEAAGRDDFAAALRLRDAAREHCRKHCAEPDLAESLAG